MCVFMYIYAITLQVEISIRLAPNLVQRLIYRLSLKMGYVGLIGIPGRHHQKYYISVTIVFYNIYILIVLNLNTYYYRISKKKFSSTFSTACVIHFLASMFK